MKALLLNDINDIAIKEVEKPEIKPGEVLVKVKACGICGSDIPRAYKTGAHKSPIIIGHEFAGEIVECGDEVASWMFDASDYIGKRVGVFPLIPCCNCNLAVKVNSNFAEIITIWDPGLTGDLQSLLRCREKT